MLTQKERLAAVRSNPYTPLRLCPINLDVANEFVRKYHRHHKPVQGSKFSIGIKDDTYSLRGAAVVGRPVARGVDAETTAEVTRLVTDGVKNGCSILYSACARSCAAMGYIKIQSYILWSEDGTSLRAAGWKFDGMTQGGDWNHSAAYAGKRRTDQPMTRKQRWVKNL